MHCVVLSKSEKGAISVLGESLISATQSGPQDKTTYLKYLQIPATGVSCLNNNNPKVAQCFTGWALQPDTQHTDLSISSQNKNKNSSPKNQCPNNVGNNWNTSKNTCDAYLKHFHSSMNCTEQCNVVPCPSCF